MSQYYYANTETCHVELARRSEVKGQRSKVKGQRSKVKGAGER